MIREKNILGATIFYDLKRAVMGWTELPAHFVAVKDDRVLIVGEPCNDVRQAAIASVGFRRAHVTRVPPGEGSKGLLVNLVA